MSSRRGSLSAGLALADVLSVFAAGSILGFLIAKVSGLPLVNPLEALARDPGQNLLPLSWQLAVILFWQYVGWGICGGLLLWLRRRNGGATAVPDERPRHSAGALLVLGLAAGALVTAPAHTIHWVQEVFDIGDTAPWRQALFDRPWTFDFWVFSAVGSFALIPLVEEAFYRGFVLGRLGESLRPLHALMFTAALFGFAHSQYLQLDLLNAAMLLDAVWGGLVFGVFTLYARSLAPAIIAHALINVPLSHDIYTYTIPALLLISAAALITLRDLRAFVGGLFREAPGAAWTVFASLGAASSMVYHTNSELIALAAIPVWFGLCLFYLLRSVLRARGQRAK